MGDHLDSILPGGENKELVACVFLSEFCFWENYFKEPKDLGECGIQTSRRQGGMCETGKVGHTLKMN